MCRPDLEKQQKKNAAFHDLVCAFSSIHKTWNPFFSHIRPSCRRWWPMWVFRVEGFLGLGFRVLFEIDITFAFQLFFSQIDFGMQKKKPIADPNLNLLLLHEMTLSFAF